MWTKTLLLLWALISNIAQGLQPGGPPSNTSCISAVHNQGQFNETHTEMTFLVSCDYSSLIITSRQEEEEVPQSSTSGRFCQIIGGISKDPYKKCVCKEEKGSGVLRRCTVQIPIFENCTLLTSQVLEMRIFVNGHFSELVLIHVPVVDFTQWEQANCHITPTPTTTTTIINKGKNNVSNYCHYIISNNNNKTDDDDDDKAILMIALIALAAVSFVSLCLHIIDCIVIGLWMIKQRTGESTPEKREEPDRRERSIPVRQRSESGYEIPVPVDTEATGYIELI